MPGDPAAIGPYRLTARLGAGGMGQVFLGHSVSGRRVAVKVVRPELAADPGFRLRFRREIDAARTVGGFWTAPVVDADPEAAAPWVASAYIEAPDLGVLVEDEGPLGEGALRGLAVGLAEALEAIHRAGLVHRDMKPSNVLVTGDGPRVIDFGISKALEGGMTLTGTGLVVGTPGFMSPEQATGARVGAPSDVFSLGAVLAFAATGDGPFGVGSVPALLYRVVHDVPRLDGVPDGLRDVVARCLEKRAEARPTAGQLLELLGEVAAEPVVAPTAVLGAEDAVPAPSAARERAGRAGQDPGAGQAGQAGQGGQAGQAGQGGQAGQAGQGGQAGQAGRAGRVADGDPQAVVKATTQTLTAKNWLLLGASPVILGLAALPVFEAGFVAGGIAGVVAAVGAVVLGLRRQEREVQVRADARGLVVIRDGVRWSDGWDRVDFVTLVPRGGPGHEWSLLAAARGGGGRPVPAALKGGAEAGSLRLDLRFPDTRTARARIQQLHLALERFAGAAYEADRAVLSR
ncbi:serine/threonine-protein kinase [Streptomyces sp. NPDC014870]|uniref:serine/threonine-protein kinase n=1 Tax=Streptomyces sp. NPDC014870 TaxID=3364925 RepID=UPI0036FB73C7